MTKVIFLFFLSVDFDVKHAWNGSEVFHPNKLVDKIHILQLESFLQILTRWFVSTLHTKHCTLNTEQ